MKVIVFLVFLPVPGDPLHAKFMGPYTIEKKVNETNYVINTPDRRKKQWVCHINMLKQYFGRDVKPKLVTQKVSSWEEEKEVTQDLSWPGSNSEVLGNLD